MEKMLFTDQQPNVTITLLPNSKRDVRVLTHEEIVIMENLTSQEESPAKTMMFRYDGNQFRTVYELTEAEILENLDKYLRYTSDNEPTLRQITRERELIDNYTMELMEGGLL